MNYFSLLLSKAIENNDPAALTRFGITESDAPTKGEREAFRFITDYAEKNRNQAPTAEMVVAECSEFVPEFGIDMAYEYLRDKIKSHSAKLAIVDLVENKLSSKFESEDGNILVDGLISDLESIKIRTSVRSKVGTNIKTDTDSFLSEYRKRKAGDSFKIWKSKFPTVNESIGGYFSGNMYTFYGRSGRGKSVITMEEALEMAFQGATVLVWAMEMSKFEWMARAYSSISAREGLISATIEGVDYEVGFENKALLMGRLDDEFEAAFEIFLATINEKIPGNIIVRAADDEDFYQRGIKQLEADIQQVKADVVVLDAFYHMDYERNTSRTSGGDAANTSMKLKKLAGYTQTVIFAVTQAEEVSNDKDENGNRELKLPERSEVKKTSAVLEDATNLIAIDSLDGRALIGLNKGRNGGEGTTVELIYLPNFGIVREPETGEAAASQFDF